MKSFGSRFTAAFNTQGGQGMKFFRLGSGRKNYRNGSAVDRQLMRNVGGSPLVKLEQFDDISPRIPKNVLGPMVNKEAGLLFGVAIASTAPDFDDMPGLRRYRSEGDFHKNSAGPTNLDPHCDVLLPDLYPFSPLESGRESAVPPSTGSSLLVPTHAPSATSHGLMKTSHSETSFKPLQADSTEATSGQRALALSNTALDRTAEKGTAGGSAMVKLPLLFKRKPEDAVGLGEKRKFAQFQERIQKSKTKFVLL